MAALETIHPYNEPNQSHRPTPLSPSPTTLTGSQSDPIHAQQDSWTARALAIPEIVLQIQEQLKRHRPSLLHSIRVSRLWYRSGHHLVWRTVDWDNSMKGSAQEDMMVSQSHRIRTLRCMFHSQGGTSCLDSSKLLRSFVMESQPTAALAYETEKQQVESLGDDQPMTLISSVGSKDAQGNYSNNNNNNNKTVVNTSCSMNGDMLSSVPRKSLQQLYLNGHFDLCSVSSVSSLSSASYFSFKILTLTRLDIRPTVRTTVDIHLILDSATRLQHLTIYAHGSFIDSRDIDTAEEGEKEASVLESVSSMEAAPVVMAHLSLQSLIIQHLKISREQLESVAMRCPNLIEFQSVGAPGSLWKDRPILSALPSQFPSQFPSQSHQQSLDVMDPSKSLVRTLAQLCPRIQRFHIGLQQGGFHLNSIRETMTTFPRLESMGIPAWDCTKVTMDAIKTLQIHMQKDMDVAATTADTTRAGMQLSVSLRVAPTFLTTLCIMNVCASEKVSQAIHDYLCWTPYLKELYAYNTTLYVDQMQHGHDLEDICELTPTEDHSHSSNRSSSDGSADGGVWDAVQSREFREHNVATMAIQNIYPVIDQRLHSDLDSSTRSQNIPQISSYTPTASTQHITTTRTYSHESGSNTTTNTTSPSSSLSPPRQWACSGLERLVVRFAHLPWRNLSQPPKRSKDTFSFLKQLQNLKHLCIKEGLMLEAGREYDALRELKALEEVVFTTGYPIPIKPTDMEWMKPNESGERDDHSTTGLPRLRTVVVRRRKASGALDQDIEAWFKRSLPKVQLSLELTDCCEEEYTF
ncbi:hypothetical protein EDD11_002974 [Mortierella claussenii]|nr:hypothetical protein EDD11_002974 [Mortierella claussenii]